MSTEACATQCVHTMYGLQIDVFLISNYYYIYNYYYI